MPPTVRLRHVLWCAAVLVVASSSYWMAKSANVLSCHVDHIMDGQVKTSALSLSSLSTTSFMSKWEQSTVIVTISFGNATMTNLLERLVYSLQKNGQWHGRVVVLTDNAQHYQQSLLLRGLTTGSGGIYPNLSILQAKPEHLSPIDHRTGKPIPFKTEAMRFKRFKTLILDYLDELYSSPPENHDTTTWNGKQRQPPPSLHYEHVLYLDVEIVVARPIHSFLQDYLDQMIDHEVFYNEFGQVNETNINDDNNNNASSVQPFMSFFTDCPKCARQNFNLNGGVFLLHHKYSRVCLKEWNNLFRVGADYVTYDQRYLVTMNMAKPRLCKFWKLPDHHRIYPSRKDMRLKRSATIVHNTNTYNAKKVPVHVQRDYFTYLLNTTQYTTEELELF